MRCFVSILTVLLSSALLLTTAAGAQSVGSGRASVWFAPDNDTEDLLDMFRKPDLWASSRALINVFEFGPAQVRGQNQPAVNSLAALQSVGAFQKLQSWGIDVALEAPAVKEWDCTAVKAREVTASYIRSVANAGGSVRYIAMDEPLASGLSRCNLSMDDVARETAAYIRSFSGNGPQVGDIEAYPSRSVADLEGWIKALENQGAKPAFFHLDANIHRLDVDRRVDATGDLRELKRFFLAEQIPFGIIFWPGYNPVTSEQNYYERTMSWVRRVEAAIGRPDHVIFQSWVVRGGQNTCSNTDPRCNMQNPMCTPSDPASCGKKSVPVNLPDNDPGVFSHTRLIVDALKILR